MDLPKTQDWASTRWHLRRRRQTLRALPWERSLCLTCMGVEVWLCYAWSRSYPGGWFVTS